MQGWIATLLQIAKGAKQPNSGGKTQYGYQIFRHRMNGAEVFSMKVPAIRPIGVLHVIWRLGTGSDSPASYLGVVVDRDLKSFVFHSLSLEVA